jgi:ACS family tartrate transporter-like MFS transporter
MLYMTQWFPAPIARFTALFMSSIPLASMIGGPLSGVILGMDGLAGLHGWQWLFVVEGLPASLLGLAVFRFFPKVRQHLGYGR